jgi:hypothetical protein
MRDFGFRIYRALNDAPERAKEDEKVRCICNNNKSFACNKVVLIFYYKLVSNTPLFNVDSIETSS